MFVEVSLSSARASLNTPGLRLSEMLRELDVLISDRVSYEPRSVFLTLFMPNTEFSRVMRSRIRFWDPLVFERFTIGPEVKKADNQRADF